MMKRTQAFALLTLLLTGEALYAQVGINTTQPHESAALEIRSIDKGLLVPRVALSENPIKDPAQGLLIFETTVERFLYYDANHGWLTLNPFYQESNQQEVELDSALLHLSHTNLTLSNSHLQVNNGDISVNNGNISTSAPYVFEGYGTIPVGGIIMWSGVPNTWPENWKLCDGRSYSVTNPKTGASSTVVTPNLRGRFIVGYGANASNEGGGDVTEPVWHADYAVMNRMNGERQRILTKANLPTHHHEARNDGENGATINIIHSGDHTHGGSTVYPEVGGFGGSGGTIRKMGSGMHEHSNGSFSGVVGNGYKDLLSEPFDIRPPYYVLAFIMRIQ